jgi:hypothetical protein
VKYAASCTLQAASKYTIQAKSQNLKAESKKQIKLHAASRKHNTSYKLQAESQKPKGESKYSFTLQANTQYSRKRKAKSSGLYLLLAFGFRLYLYLL